MLNWPTTKPMIAPQTHTYKINHSCIRLQESANLAEAASFRFKERHRLCTQLYVSRDLGICGFLQYTKHSSNLDLGPHGYVRICIKEILQKVCWNFYDLLALNSRVSVNLYDLSTQRRPVQLSLTGPSAMELALGVYSESRYCLVY